MQFGAVIASLFLNPRQASITSIGLLKINLGVKNPYSVRSDFSHYSAAGTTLKIAVSS
jgi:hypothetical protein